MTGIDLDVRSKVARELGWRPVPELNRGNSRRGPVRATRLAVAVVGTGAFQ